MNGHDGYFLPFFDVDSFFSEAADFAAAGFRFAVGFPGPAAAFLSADLAAPVLAAAGFLAGATVFSFSFSFVATS